MAYELIDVTSFHAVAADTRCVVLLGHRLNAVVDVCAHLDVCAPRPIVAIRVRSVAVAASCRLTATITARISDSTCVSVWVRRRVVGVQAARAGQAHAVQAGVARGAGVAVHVGQRVVAVDAAVRWHAIPPCTRIANRARVAVIAGQHVGRANAVARYLAILPCRHFDQGGSVVVRAGGGVVHMLAARVLSGGRRLVGVRAAARQAAQAVERAAGIAGRDVGRVSAAFFDSGALLSTWIIGRRQRAHLEVDTRKRHQPRERGG